MSPFTETTFGQLKIGDTFIIPPPHALHGNVMEKLSASLYAVGDDPAGTEYTGGEGMKVLIEPGQVRTQ